MGFEPTISAGERPQTYALERAPTGTGLQYDLPFIVNESLVSQCLLLYVIILPEEDYYQ